MALKNQHKPTALLLSRQNLPYLPKGDTAADKKAGEVSGLDAISKGMVVARQMQHEREARKQLNHKLEAMAPREREVFGWLCKGYNNAEIMAAMNISLPTTKQYKASVMRQLGAGSIAQLLSMAATAGLLQPLHFMEHADKS